MRLRLVIWGAPRTKKTSNQGVRTGRVCPACKLRAGPIRVFPSKAWREWVKKARVTVGERGHDLVSCRPGPLPDRPYRCSAIFYRDADRGDMIGFAQGLADFLEQRKVISNDKWIRSWDGSRLDVDRARPRVELTIEAIA
jgi:hypothetical protein